MYASTVPVKINDQTRQNLNKSLFLCNNEMNKKLKSNKMKRMVEIQHV